MNAIELLKAQHREVSALFKRYGEAEDLDEKEALFCAIADRLAAHATIEERLFYPFAFRDRTRQILTESVEEHLAMKRVIADLLNMTPEHAHFDAKVKVLKDEVEHHIEEEEEDLFKKVRRSLGAEALQTLGRKMELLFKRELAKEPRNAVPDQTEEAASLQ